MEYSITIILKGLFQIGLIMIFTGYLSHFLEKKGRIWHNCSKRDAILIHVGGLIMVGAGSLLGILGVFYPKIIELFLLKDQLFFKLAAPIAIIVGLILAILFYKKLEEKKED